MGIREETVHTHRASVHQAANLVAALLRVARLTAGLAESNGSRIYDSRHLQADCQAPGSAPEPLYARQSSMGYLYVLLFNIVSSCVTECNFNTVRSLWCI